MRTKLTNLVITKVALVDEGSCSAAHIQLFKRKEQGGNTMDFESIFKSLAPEQQAVVKAKMDAMEEDKKKADKDKMDAEKAAADMKKAKEEAETNLAKMKQPGQTEDDILKNVDPAVKDLIIKARDKAAAAEAAILKMKEASEISESIAKAKEFESLPVQTDELATILRKSKNADEASYNKLVEVLTAANAAVVKSATFTEIGSGTPVDDIQKSRDAAWSAIEAKAVEIGKAKNTSKEAAIAIVMDEHPELYKAYLNTMK